MESVHCICDRRSECAFLFSCGFSSFPVRQQPSTNRNLILQSIILRDTNDTNPSDSEKNNSVNPEFRTTFRVTIGQKTSHSKKIPHAAKFFLKNPKIESLTGKVGKTLSSYALPRVWEFFVFFLTLVGNPHIKPNSIVEMPTVSRRPSTHSVVLHSFSVRNYTCKP